jgi:very-short-patch-repair endonuclease
MLKKSKPKTKAKREVDLVLETHVSELVEGAHIEAEFTFHAVRKWAFDYAIPGVKLAIEIEGGLWNFGRHNRGRGFQDDLDKYNSAASLGWTVFRFSTEDILKGKEIAYLREFFRYTGVGEISRVNS